MVRPEDITLKDVEAAITVLRAYISYYRKASRVLKDIAAIEMRKSSRERLEDKVLQLLLQSRTKEEEEPEEIISEEELNMSIERLRRLAEEEKRQLEQERKKEST